MGRSCLVRAVIPMPVSIRLGGGQGTPRRQLACGSILPQVSWLVLSLHLGHHDQIVLRVRRPTKATNPRPPGGRCDQVHTCGSKSSLSENPYCIGNSCGGPSRARCFSRIALSRAQICLPRLLSSVLFARSTNI